MPSDTKTRVRRFARCVPLALLAIGLAHNAIGQDTSPAATQAAAAAQSRPATQPVNHLRSPHDLVQRFLASARAVETGDADYADAMECLDFGGLAADTERLEDAGPRYVRDLLAILTALDATRHLDLQDEGFLPRDPGTATPHSIGKDPLVLVLQRSSRPGGADQAPMQQWRFSAPTVEKIPDWAARLDVLIERMDGAEATTPQAVSLRSPHDLVKFFLDNAAAASKSADLEAFQAALSCMDFSAVLAEREQAGSEVVARFMDDEGPTYLRGLESILEELIGAGDLVLDSLPRQPDPARKATYALAGKSRADGSPLQVLLVRTGDVSAGTGRWHFASQTVQDLPRMATTLKRDAPAGPTATPEPAPPAAAAPPPAAEAPSGDSRAAAPDVEDTYSPRATLETFLAAMKESDPERAVQCLDLSGLSDSEQELADLLAGKLWLALTRDKRIVLQTVPDDPKWGMAFTVLEHSVRRIEIAQQAAGKRRGQWLFTRRSVANIEPIYEALQSRPVHEDWRGERLRFWTLPSLYVREYVVPAGLKSAFLGLRVWQWIGIGLVLVVGLVVRLLCGVLLPRVGGALLRTETTQMMPRALRDSLRPTCTLAMVAAWWGGLQLLDLGSPIMSWVWFFLKIVMTVVGVHASYRLVDVVMSYFASRAAATKSRLDDVLVPLLTKTLKVVVVAVGLVFIVSAFGREIDPLLAGLGIGGLAFSFAAKDTIANFFGSVNVVLDRPFQVGDWVKIGDAEGTVESVGLRSSRIRTFYNSQLTIPNAEIMTATVDNMGRRRYRRTSTAISVTYATTPEQLEAFCEGIREIIRKHPHTRKDYFHVYVKAFAASWIDIMLYCFHECPDWGAELQERHRLYLDIIRLARRLGVDFAFPTQTLHLRREDLPPESAGPPVPADPEQAMEFGAALARDVVGGTLKDRAAQAAPRPDDPSP